MANPFDWTARENDDTAEGVRRYDEQSEALALTLMVNRQAILLLAAFDEYSSDHERIAACRRAFRSSARFVSGAKIRTMMLRDSDDDPAAVLGYLDVPPTLEELREGVSRL